MWHLHTRPASLLDSSSNMDLEFLKLEIHIRSWVFKTRVLCKNNFTYSSVLKLYSDVLKPYSGVFLQKKFISTRFREPYHGVFKPYSDVLKPYSGVFLQFIEIESLKLDFHVDFFRTLNQSSYKSRLKNSSFILKLEF